MGKTKPGSKSSGKKNQNTPGAARVRYLHQAATYLATANITERDGDKGRDDGDARAPSKRTLPSHLVTHMLGTSRKAQIRLDREIKHAVCKRCNAALIPGTSCSIRIENDSKEGKKPWADVKVHECLQCGAKKRFPIGAKRQLKKEARASHGADATAKVPVMSKKT